jgi:hypothetical protein
MMCAVSNFRLLRPEEVTIEKLSNWVTPRMSDGGCATVSRSKAEAGVKSPASH